MLLMFSNLWAGCLLDHIKWTFYIFFVVSMLLSSVAWLHWDSVYWITQAMLFRLFRLWIRLSRIYFSKKLFRALNMPSSHFLKFVWFSCPAYCACLKTGEVWRWTLNTSYSVGCHTAYHLTISVIGSKARRVSDRTRQAMVWRFACSLRWHQRWWFFSFCVVRFNPFI